MHKDGGKMGILLADPYRRIYEMSKTEADESITKEIKIALEFDCQ